MISASWVWTRVALPLVAAAGFLALRWGRENLLFYLALPPFVIVLRMAVASLEFFGDDALRKFPPYRRAVRLWNVCDVGSFFCLMLFEVGIAVSAEQRASPGVIAGVIVGFYVPYLWLALAARAHGEMAHGIAQLMRECLADVGAQPSGCAWGYPIEAVRMQAKA